MAVANPYHTEVLCVAERVADEAAREAARQQQQEAEAAAAASLVAAAVAGEQQQAEGAHAPGALPAQQQQPREGHVGSEGGAVPPAEPQETAEQRVTRLLEVRGVEGPCRDGVWGSGHLAAGWKRSPQELMVYSLVGHSAKLVAVVHACVLLRRRQSFADRGQCIITPALRFPGSHTLAAAPLNNLYGARVRSELSHTDSSAPHRHGFRLDWPVYRQYASLQTASIKLNDVGLPLLLMPPCAPDSDHQQHHAAAERDVGLRARGRATGGARPGGGGGGGGVHAAAQEAGAGAAQPGGRGGQRF